MSDEPEAVVVPPTETVTTEVDPKLVEFEAQRQKFEADKKAFEAERNTFVASKKDVPASDAFSIDDAIENPMGYFKTKHSLDEEQVLDLVRAVLFEKQPDQAPPDWNLRKATRKVERIEKNLTRKQQEMMESAKAEAEEKAAAEYNQRIIGEFQTASEGRSDATPYSQAFFDSNEEYMQGLMSIAQEVAVSTKKIPSTKEVVDAMEDWLKKRYSRLQLKQVQEEKQEEAKIDTSKASDGVQPTLSEGRTPSTDRLPLSREERYKNAIAAAKSMTKD